MLSLNRIILLLKFTLFLLVVLQPFLKVVIVDLDLLLDSDVLADFIFKFLQAGLIARTLGALDISLLLVLVHLFLGFLILIECILHEKLDEVFHEGDSFCGSGHFLWELDFIGFLRSDA